MRQEINDQELDMVTGGTVYLSKDKMKVGFSTTGEKFDLKNCTYREAHNLAEDLWEANQTLGDAAFDALVKSEMKSRGWI